mmetsp:Transcript_3746/g.8470  ORF Transcript_3746/g.8470 Transcript_3746/m.8470 type:complete len:208 (-) Transcript_3746:556-1179(-)
MTLMHFSGQRLPGAPAWGLGAGPAPHAPRSPGLRSAVDVRYSALDTDATSGKAAPPSSSRTSRPSHPRSGRHTTIAVMSSRPWPDPTRVVHRLLARRTTARLALVLSGQHRSQMLTASALPSTSHTPSEATIKQRSSSVSARCTTTGVAITPAAASECCPMARLTTSPPKNWPSAPRPHTRSARPSSPHTRPPCAVIRARSEGSHAL